jgi:hypothetical protein
MSNCIERFGERMNELMDRYEAVIHTITELANQAGVFLVEDVYFAGLLSSNCEKYRYGENSGFIGICGNKLFEVVSISYEVTHGNTYPIHNALVNTYYKNLPSMSYGEVTMLEDWNAKITLQRIYPGMGAGAVYVVVPRWSLNDTARRFNIPAPGFETDLDDKLVIITLSIGGYRFGIKYNGYRRKAYIEGVCPQGFESSPIACAIADTAVGIIADAINLYEDITKRGIKFVSIYLLY